MIASLEHELRDGAEEALPPLTLRVGVAALGPLARFAADSAVTDMLVNGTAGLWLDRGAGPRPERGWPPHTEPQLRALATTLIASAGRHIDEATPCVDVRLAGGIRVHAVLPPISTVGTVISVRLPAAEPFSFAGLIDAGLLTPGQAETVRHAVAARANILITGAAGSGKTTFLAALLGLAPTHERIIVIEDVAELRIDHPHCVVLEARQPNLEGAGGIGADALVRQALRMRPDRLIVGECRGAEIRELLTALNTGHDGGAGTLHANSLRDVPARLEALAALAGMSRESLARQAVSAIDLVIHLVRTDKGRAIAGMGVLAAGTDGTLVVRPLADEGNHVEAQ